MLLPLLLNLDTPPQNFQGQGNLLGFLFPLNLEALPTTPTLLVEAVSEGFYAGIFRNIGDRFYIAPQDFEDSTIDYAEGDPGYPEFGWMKLAPPGAQPYASWSTAGETVATQRRTVF